MKRKFTLTGLLALLFISSTLMPPPYGLDKAEAIGAFLNGTFPSESPSFGSWKAKDAFPNITFTDPIAMAQVPGQDAYFVAGKQGIIWLVEGDSATEKNRTGYPRSGHDLGGWWSDQFCIASGIWTDRLSQPRLHIPLLSASPHDKTRK
ncbi:MAG: hypothetical protein R3B47_09305 [Bacteroidia bacterium]